MAELPFSIIHWSRLYPLNMLSLLVYKLLIFITLATINTLQCLPFLLWGQGWFFWLRGLKKYLCSDTHATVSHCLGHLSIFWLPYWIAFVIWVPWVALCDGWLWRNEPACGIFGSASALRFVSYGGYPYLIP